MRRNLFKTASFRFTMWYVVVFCLSVGALGWVLMVSVRHALEEQTRRHIESEAAQLLGDYRDDGIDELRHDIRERIEAKPSSRLYYAIQRPGSGALFDPLPPIAADGLHRMKHASGAPLLLWSEMLDDGDRLVIAANLESVVGVERIFRHRFAAMLLLALLIGGVGGLLISRRFLSRVERLGKSAEKIGHGYLSERITLSGSGDEFDQLAQVINQMLGRIELLMQDVQQVSSAIAHDLRTPLAKLRQKLELLAAEKPDEQLDAAIMLLDEALATFAALLRIAEVESGSRKAAFAPLDLSALAHRMAECYAPLAEEAGCTLHHTIAPEVWVVGDVALLTQLLANLIENAIRHGGAGCTITLALAASGELSVTDTGKGIMEADIELLTKPFFRLDASRHTRGNGLGLSLCKAVAGLHQAELRLVAHNPGLSVSLHGLALAGKHRSDL